MAAASWVSWNVWQADRVLSDILPERIELLVVALYWWFCTYARTGVDSPVQLKMDA
jgi:hypothetical protein